MLIVRYKKTDGAQFISHLDTLRHLQKIILRCGIEVKYSQGFNPHMLIFMSAPLGVGIASFAEYFALDTDFSGEDFINLFNQNCPKGFECLKAVNTQKKVNLQADMNSAEYLIKGVNRFDIKDFFAAKSFVVTDKKGKVADVFDRVTDLKYGDNGLIATLSFGNLTLRPDVFGEKLKSVYGGDKLDFIKLNAYIDSVTPEDWGKT